MDEDGTGLGNGGATSPTAPDAPSYADAQSAQQPETESLEADPSGGTSEETYNVTPDETFNYTDENGHEARVDADAQSAQQPEKASAAPAPTKDSVFVDSVRDWVHKYGDQSERISHEWIKIDPALISQGESYESGGTGAAAGAILANWFLGDITPDARDWAALAGTIPQSHLNKVEANGAGKVGKESVGEGAAKAPKEAAPGLGERMLKEEHRSGLNVDLAAQQHKDKTTYREGSGKDVQSAHMVNSSSVRDIPDYVPNRALTVLLPTEQHKAFDDNWKARAREMLANAEPGKEVTVKVAEWEKVLNEAAESVPGLRGRTADTMSFMIRTELYQTLGLKPDQEIRVPFSK